MWEKTREDGSRRLKHDAVPTLFCFTKEVKKRKPPKNRQMTKPLDPKMEVNSVDASEPLDNNLNHVQGLSDGIIHNNLSNNDQLYKSMVFKINHYKKQSRFLSDKLKKNETNKSAKLLNSIFNNDQTEALSRKSTRFMKWSNPTICKALKIKFSCGNNGYEEVLKQKIPLPSQRTLRRRLQMLKFDSGILNEVFKFLEIKVQTFKDTHEKECVLIMDEMAIIPSNVFDVSLNKNVGNITLPNHEGTATNVLVFMLGGISTRWKQTVAYYFTGPSVNGTVYSNIITDLIIKCESIGLKVMAITSDMGSSNQRLWKYWNITAKKCCKVSNFLPHPLDDNRKLFVIADVPHLFKNIKNMLMTNKVLFISNELQEKYELPTNIVCCDHIQDVINYQDQLHFHLAPKLSQNDLVPSHFQKMKVGKSTNVISHDVCSALRFLADELNKPEYLTTAWFIETIEHWFSLMTSRHIVMALSKLKPDIYEKSIIFLNNFIEIMTHLEVGHKRSWKPSQSGSILSTTSILDLQNIYLNEKGFHFLLTSRFTQDCLENLFSVLRTKNIIPNALQFKNDLKLISVSQYLKDVSRGSYDEDDRHILSGFIDVLDNSSPNTTLKEVQLPIEIDEPDMNLCNGELNSLYNVCGYIIHSIKQKSKLCSFCLSSVGSNKSINTAFSKLTKLKRFKKGCLFFCNEITFNLFLSYEGIFRKYYFIIKDQNCDIKQFLICKMKEIVNVHIPNCHKLLDFIINRYVLFRLKIAGKNKIKLANKYGSKSVANHL